MIPIYHLLLEPYLPSVFSPMTTKNHPKARYVTQLMNDLNLMR